jgi:hypothetical protein
MKKILMFILMGGLVSSAFCQECKELDRTKMQGVRQAVAASEYHLFLVANDTIRKYSKKGVYDGFYSHPKLIHLNSGIVQEGKLFCAHSNYPTVPMWSSIEVFDIETHQHLESHSFGIDIGSCTWIDFYDDHYYVMFAHYSKESNRMPNRDVSWSQLVKFDKDWRRKEAWVLPGALIEKLHPYSLSGGIILSNGKLLCTHHHHQELYLLSFPKIGAELVWEKTIPCSICGQGIAVDPLEPNTLWGICKKNGELIKTRLELNDL